MFSTFWIGISFISSLICLNTKYSNYKTFKLISSLNIAATDSINHKIILTDLKNLTVEEIRFELTSVKGTGKWTTDVYLIFCSQHPDIFPEGDIAAMKKCLWTNRNKKQRRTFELHRKMGSHENSCFQNTLAPLFSITKMYLLIIN